MNSFSYQIHLIKSEFHKTTRKKRQDKAHSNLSADKHVLQYVCLVAQSRNTRLLCTNKRAEFGLKFDKPPNRVRDFKTALRVELIIWRTCWNQVTPGDWIIAGDAINSSVFGRLLCDGSIFFSADVQQSIYELIWRHTSKLAGLIYELCLAGCCHKRGILISAIFSHVSRRKSRLTVDDKGFRKSDIMFNTQLKSVRNLTQALQRGQLFLVTHLNGRKLEPPVHCLTLISHLSSQSSNKNRLGFCK